MKRQKAFPSDLLREVYSEPTLKPLTGEEVEEVSEFRENLPLSLVEEQRLHEFEQIIHNGLHTFVAVGAALMQIRSRRLYRQEYKTFEAYAQNKWGIKRQRAYELMGASEVSQNLSEISDILPAKESHAAALLKLSPKKQREVWHSIIEEAGENVDKLTASDIRKMVKARTTQPDAPENTWQEEQVKPLARALKKSPEQLFITLSGSWLIQHNLEHVWRELRGVSRKIDANFSDVISLGEAFELGLLKPGK